MVVLVDVSVTSVVLGGSLVVLGASVVVLDVVVVGSRVVDSSTVVVSPQTPHEIRQFCSIYSGFCSHCPVLAHNEQSSFVSSQTRVVVVGVGVMVVVVVSVVLVAVVVVLGITVVVVSFVTQTPQDTKQFCIM